MGYGQLGRVLIFISGILNRSRRNAQPLQGFLGIGEGVLGWVVTLCGWCGTSRPQVKARKRRASNCPSRAFQRKVGVLFLFLAPPVMCSPNWWETKVVPVGDFTYSVSASKVNERKDLLRSTWWVQRGSTELHSEDGTGI